MKEATWYHAEVRKTSRGDNKSAVGLAAYVTGERLKDEENNRWCKRGHPGEVESWGTVAPQWAPDYLTEPKMLGRAWNDVQKSETRINSHLANHWDIALYRHGTPEEHAEVMFQIAKNVSKRYGILVTWAVHQPSGEGSDDNWHGHLAHNMRRVTIDGFGEKAREIVANGSKNREVKWVRAMIADVINQYLERKGVDERVSHLSYREREIDKLPTEHLGNNQFQAEKKGERTKGGDRNREKRKLNAEAEREDKAHDAAIAKAQSNIVNLEAERRKRDMASPDDDNLAKFDQRITEQQTALGQAQNRVDDAKEILARMAADQEESKREKLKLEEERRARLATADIADPRARWLQAAEHYDARRHFSSMAQIVGAEGSAAKKEFVDLTRDAKNAKTEDQRTDILLRRDIQYADYMAITSQRMVGITQVIGGRGSELPQKERDKQEYWEQQSAKLRDQLIEHRGLTEDKQIAKAQDQIDALESAAIRGKDVPVGANRYRDVKEQQERQADLKARVEAFKARNPAREQFEKDLKDKGLGPNPEAKPAANRDRAPNDQAIRVDMREQPQKRSDDAKWVREASSKNIPPADQLEAVNLLLKLRSPEWRIDTPRLGREMQGANKDLAAFANRSKDHNLLAHQVYARARKGSIAPFLAKLGPIEQIAFLKHDDIRKRAQQNSRDEIRADRRPPDAKPQPLERGDKHIEVSDAAREKIDRNETAYVQSKEERARQAIHDAGRSLGGRSR